MWLHLRDCRYESSSKIKNNLFRFSYTHNHCVFKLYVLCVNVSVSIAAILSYSHLKACHHHPDIVIKTKEYAISLAHFCREVGHRWSLELRKYAFAYSHFLTIMGMNNKHAKILLPLMFNSTSFWIVPSHFISLTL